MRIQNLLHLRQGKSREKAWNLNFWQVIFLGFFCARPSHAAPIARKLSRALAKRSRKKTLVSFGDILLKVRRQLLAEGMPIALCLTAYGDANWQFAPFHEVRSPS